MTMTMYVFLHSSVSYQLVCSYIESNKRLSYYFKVNGKCIPIGYPSFHSLKQASIWDGTDTPESLH